MACHSKFLYNEDDHYKNYIKYKVAKKIQEIKNRKNKNKNDHYKNLRRRIAYFLDIAQSL